jgi:hypothetical protein
MSVQALLRRSKKALEGRPTRGQDLEKLKAGENYLRIFPNKADPENGDFFHPYGLHYAANWTGWQNSIFGGPVSAPYPQQTLRHLRHG